MAKKTINTPSTSKRPPVVVVMGHVDHGKTTLLDTIRKTNVAAKESGGITQHIGAYQAQVRADDPNSLITFIDTPGHEAFSKMRSRGANVADLAILVVAANDGVKPQTKEAISHIKKAGIPFVVAVNKIDLEGVNPEIVKAQLAENGVLVEGYGGDVVIIPISAKKNIGINQLLEMVELLYQLSEKKEEKNNLEAIVLESYVDPQKGVVANILVRSGEINVGQLVHSQGETAKVRNLTDEHGKLLQKAVVSQPAQMLGFKDVLTVGSLVVDAKDVQKEVSVIPQSSTPQLPAVAEVSENTEIVEEQPEHLKVIIKTDVAGTLEAIKANLSDEIDLVGEGIGDISDSDILLAQSTGARLIGFRVKIPAQVKKLAEMEGVKIETFDVIYHLLEDLQKRVLKLMEPTINEQELGKAEVIAEFKIKGSHITGCKVTEGIILKSGKVRILREGKTIAEPRIAAMQVERQEAKEAKTGQEVALVFRPDVKFKIGDIVLSYKIVDD